MDKQKQFEEMYEKFVRKCLTQDIIPMVTLQYEVNGIFPVLKYLEVDEDRKKEILSSLNKKEK